MRRYSSVRFEVDGAVATITLDRPDRMNALSHALLGELGEALDEAASSGARALILTGAGDAFSSGADLIVSGGAIPEDLGQALADYFEPVVRRIAALPIPVVTAMNGPAIGAGLSIALSGDIVIAARSSYLLLAFVNIGLVPDSGATWLVAKGAGRAMVLEMALLGERMTADDALDAGLVTRVVDDDVVLVEAMAVAQRLASLPTTAIGMIRRQVAMGLAASFEETLDVERENQRKAGRTRDFREGVQAFIEKRKPEFEGR